MLRVIFRPPSSIVLDLRPADRTGPDQPVFNGLRSIVPAEGASDADAQTRALEQAHEIARTAARVG